VVRRDPPVGQELGNGQVVGVVGAQPSAGVQIVFTDPIASAEPSSSSTSSRQASL
jgi:hypothetical protein